MPKDDPLQQDYAGQVREQMEKHTLWLNSKNFEEMVRATHEGLIGQHAAGNPPDLNQWRDYCAAALAVVEWRMGGRVKP